MNKDSILDLKDIIRKFINPNSYYSTSDPKVP